MLEYFPNEIWNLILEHLHNYKDLLHIRVNRQINEIFFVKVKDSSTIYPRRTFIQEACMMCDCNTFRTISYSFDQFPIRHIFFCNDTTCFLKALATYIKDVNQQRIYPFLKMKDSDKYFWIPRTNGGHSLGKLESRTPIYMHDDDNLYVNVTFSHVVEYSVHSFETSSLDGKRLSFDCHKRILISQLGETVKSLFHVNHLFSNAILCKLKK